MADRKLSASTDLGAEPASDDLMMVVDVSDTTDAASGTNKKVAWSVLKAVFALAAKGVTNGDSHDHNGGDGAAITEAAITLADNTTNDVSTTKHGFVPKGNANAAQFLNGNGAWATPAGAGDVVAPATNTDSYIPQWNGANSKTLKDGLAVPTGGLAGLTSPSFTTPTLGAASATSINKVTITAPATSATLTIANGATLTASATATVSGTNTGDQTIPVKASGAEINTGTDDDKFATAKAIADSKLSYTDGTETLTNKRITARVQSVSDAATITPNAENDDCVDITAIAQAFTIATPVGTPTNFQKLMIRIKDNGTARAITWDSGYVAGGVALPTTTVLSKILTLGFIYNTANSLNKWQLVASAQEA